MQTLNKAMKVVNANLKLHQIAVIFKGEFKTRSISGQGEELFFDDGSEMLVMDNLGTEKIAYLVYDKTIDIYKMYDVEGREV